MNKYFLLISLILIIFSTQSRAQWFLQFTDPNPQVYMSRIDFVSVDTGWAAGPWEMIKTTDGGTSWDTLIQIPEINVSIRAISFIDGNTGWYTEMNSDQNNCKIYKTINGGDDWSLQYISPQFTSIWDMTFITPDIGYAVGSDPSFPVLWKTTDSGITWNMITIDSVYMPFLSKIFFLDSLHGWAAGDGIYSTSNGGYTWNMIIGPYDAGIQDIQFTSVDVGYYSDFIGVYKTIDGGNNWFLQTAGGDGWHTTSIHFIDSDTGYYCPYWAIKKTTDGGFSWFIQLQADSINLAGNLTDVEFVNPDYGWALNYNPFRIFHTVNGGLPVELVSFDADPQGSNVILRWETATENNNRGFEIEKSQKSKVKSQKWKTIGFAEGNGTTMDRHIYRFTDNDVSPGKYIYRLKQIDFDGSYEYSNEVEVNINAPLRFSLGQNYPNPFNPATTISYQLPVDGLVILKVYNSLGEEVLTLVNEEKPAGTHQVELDGSSLPSGVYIYRLTAGRNTAARKLLLIK